MIEEAANASPLSSVKRKLSEKELLMQEVEKQNQEEQEDEEEK